MSIEDGSQQCLIRGFIGGGNDDGNEASGEAKGGGNAKTPFTPRKVNREPDDRGTYGKSLKLLKWIKQI
jgi:hypothetical protein